MSQAAKQEREGLYPTRVAKVVSGVGLSTLNFWDRIGLANSTIKPTGTGSDRWYNFTDLLVLAAMAALQHETNIALRRLVAAEIRRDPTADVVRVKMGLLETIVMLGKLRDQLKGKL